MKNILFLLSFLCLSFSVIAQSTTPRFGTKPNQDNTYQSLNCKFVNTADAAGADTIKLSPYAFTTLVIPSGTITDSLAYSLKSLKTSDAGDMLRFSFINSSGSGHKIKFVGSGWQVSSSGTSIALTASKRATIVFMFDGVAWVEVSRVVQ